MRTPIHKQATPVLLILGALAGAMQSASILKWPSTVSKTMPLKLPGNFTP